VVVRHALRNALIPVVTLIGLQAPILIGGAVIVEQIFVIPGMGAVAARFHQPARLPDHHGCESGDWFQRDADQSRGGFELGPARSQGEISLMALVSDIPVVPASRERSGVIHFLVRLFREKPLGAAGGVIFILSFCAEYSRIFSRPTA